MRDELDNLIEGTTGAEYQAIKNEYSALKTIEKDVARQVFLEARKNPKGLIDFTDIVSGGDLISGVLTANPALIVRGAASRGIKEWIKALNNPNRYIKKAFDLIDKVSSVSTKLPKGKAQLEGLKAPVINNVQDLLNLAPEANVEIQQIGRDVTAKIPGARWAEGPIKKPERITEKAMKDYKGDYSKMKDVVRGTVVVKVPEDISKAVGLLNPKEFPVKVQSAKTDPMGYSGIITNHRASNGLVGEVQVNMPQIIFAKEKEEIARGVIGNDVYDEIAKKAGIEGGRGHQFYEDWQKLDGDSPEAIALAEEAKKYYDLFRSIVLD